MSAPSSNQFLNLFLNLFLILFLNLLLILYPAPLRRGGGVDLYVVFVSLPGNLFGNYILNSPHWFVWVYNLLLGEHDYIAGFQPCSASAMYLDVLEDYG